jgi:hypothetical protein
LFFLIFFFLTCTHLLFLFFPIVFLFRQAPLSLCPFCLRKIYLALKRTKPALNLMDRFSQMLAVYNKLKIENDAKWVTNLIDTLKGNRKPNANTTTTSSSSSSSSTVVSSSSSSSSSSSRS